MALESVSSVKSIGELLAPIGRHIGYLFRYGRNTGNVKNQVAKLEALRKDVEVSVDAAEKNVEEIKSEVETWLRNVETITTEVHKLNGEVDANKRCFSGLCPDWISRYKLSKQAIKNVKDILQLLGEGKFEGVSHPAPPPRIESVVSTGDFQEFESTRRIMEEVMKALKDEKVNVIGVYGMGGVGKTTLVKQVLLQAKKDGLFHHVVMAVVSQNPDIRRIQGQIADILGLKLEQESTFGRAGRVKERIVRETSILVILDDLWKKLELSQVGIPSGSELENCKCKILVTTRREHVCLDMGSQEKIGHNLLSEQDSWMLFRRNSDDAVDSPDLNDVAWKIVRECRGLPIALVTVARALRGKDRVEWNEAARRLERSKPVNPDEEGDVFKSIKLSYDYLKGDDTRKLFLMCCMFPEDYDIKMDDLVKYGMGLGLFEDVDTMEQARGSAHTMANDLKRTGLLLDSDREGCIKMHDVVRDNAILIASRGNEHSFMVQAGFALKEWPRKDTFESYTAISLMSNQICELPDGLNCSNLQTLLLQKNYKLKVIPNAFFERLKELKVLDLSDTAILSLPLSLGFPTNLRTLCLDRCRRLSDISMLGKLKKLEILSIKESCIKALPKEIGLLTNLRMLDFENNESIEAIPPNVISSLSRLEELNMQASFTGWWHGVEGNGERTQASFSEITCLPLLTALRVDIRNAQCIPRNVSSSPKWERFDIHIDTRDHLFMISRPTLQSRLLTLNIPTNTLPDWFNKVVSERAEKLSYVRCRGLENILVECDQGRFNSLKSLIVQDCDGIYYLMNAVDWIPNEPLYQSLEELRIFNTNFKEICIGQLPNGSLGNLKFLYVNDCEHIMNALLTSNVLQRLQNLEILSVSRSSVKEVFRFDGLDEGQTLFRRLTKIKLNILPELTKIWNGPPRLAIFQDLRVITLVHCKKLRNVFTPAISQGLLQLEDLWVEYCNGLKEIVEEGEGEEVTIKIMFPQLKTLSLRFLSHITSFYSGSAPIECPSLQHLHVQYCPNFKTSTSDFQSRNQVQVNCEQHMVLLRNRLGMRRRLSDDALDRLRYVLDQSDIQLSNE